MAAPPAVTKTPPSPPSDDEDNESLTSDPFDFVELPPLPPVPPNAANATNEKQLRSALIGACKRMPHNAEAHFHLGLMHLRRCEGEPALVAFERCNDIYRMRLTTYKNSHIDPPQRLLSSVARLRAHTVLAAQLAAVAKSAETEPTQLMRRQQEDLIAAMHLDSSQFDLWNALALLHLNMDDFHNAKDIILAIREQFPEYLDVLNNLGLCELGLGNDEEAVSCFQKVLLCDRSHTEALCNYGLVMLRHGLFESALQSYRSAVETAPPHAAGLAFAWAGLAVSHAALNQLQCAERAAQTAELHADPLNKPRFSMLCTSIHARRIISMRCDSGAGPALDVPTADAERDDESAAPPVVEGVVARHIRPHVKREQTLEQEAPAARPTKRPRKPLPSSSSPSSPVRSATPPPPPPPPPLPSSSSQQQQQQQQPLDSLDLSLQSQSLTHTQSQSSSLPPLDFHARNMSFKHPVGRCPPITDLRASIDSAVLRLRAIAMHLKVNTATTALGAVLRVRHEFGPEESGNRNFGAEAAERLVEALEMDVEDTPAWTQLSLLQLSAGEYGSAREFAIQGVSRDWTVEGGLNCVAVAGMLTNDISEAEKFLNHAVSIVRCTYKKASPDEENVPAKRLLRPQSPISPSQSPRSIGKKRDINAAGRNVLAVLYNNLGNLRRQEGPRKYAEALRAYEMSLKIGGESAIVYNNLALLYITVGRHDDAEAMLAHALELDPKLECALSNHLKLKALITQKAKAPNGDVDPHDEMTRDGYDAFADYDDASGREFEDGVESADDADRGNQDDGGSMGPEEEDVDERRDDDDDMTT